MRKGQQFRTGETQTIGGERIFGLLRRVQCVQKERPALLQKGKEGCCIDNERQQRPLGKAAIGVQQLCQPFGDGGGNAQLGVVEPQQRVQEIGFRDDQLGRNAKDVAQNKRFGGVITHAVGRQLALGGIERVQVTAIEQLDDPIAEIGKEIAQRKGQLSAGLEQIIGQGGKLGSFEAQNHDQIGRLTPIPAITVVGFVGITKFNRIGKFKQVKAAPA